MAPRRQKQGAGGAPIPPSTAAQPDHGSALATPGGAEGSTLKWCYWWPGSSWPPRPLALRSHWEPGIDPCGLVQLALLCTHCFGSTAP